MRESRDLRELEQAVGYCFRDFQYLEMAMTHSSFTNESHIDKLDCNERMEFLGDAVLELISSEFLYREYPELPEGDLTIKRASIVCESSLAISARQLQLGDYLRLGKGEDMTGGRERDSILSDAMEALIGAVYLDGGFANAKELVEAYVLNDLDNKTLFYDSKTILQEIVQGRKLGEPRYRLVREEGPDHNKVFEVELVVDGRVYGPCRGRSKKSAEQEAAYRAVLALKGRQSGDTCI